MESESRSPLLIPSSGVDGKLQRLQSSLNSGNSINSSMMIKKGYLKKQKTGKKKLFVLFKHNDNLWFGYHDSEKKYDNWMNQQSINPSGVKKPINLTIQPFSINRRMMIQSKQLTNSNGSINNNQQSNNNNPQSSTSSSQQSITTAASAAASTANIFINGLKFTKSNGPQFIISIFFWTSEPPFIVLSDDEADSKDWFNLMINHRNETLSVAADIGNKIKAVGVVGEYSLIVF